MSGPRLIETAPGAPAHGAPTSYVAPRGQRNRPLSPPTRKSDHVPLRIDAKFVDKSTSASVPGLGLVRASEEEKEEEDEREWVSVVVGGNPGAGKSFNLNALLGRERFVQRFSASAVTTVPDCERSLSLSIGGAPVRTLLWNLPGTVEPRGRNADRNRAAVELAFRSAPRQLLVFVARHSNGRISHEDVALFSEYVRVYGIRPESVVLLLNGMPSELTTVALGFAWAETARALFSAASGIQIAHCGLLRDLPRCPNGAFDWSGADAQFNAAVLKDFINRATPQLHTKAPNQRIELGAQRLSAFRATVDRLLAEIADAIKQHALSMAAADQRMTDLCRLVDQRNRAYHAALAALNMEAREVGAQQQRDISAHAQQTDTLRLQMGETARRESQATAQHQAAVTELTAAGAALAEEERVRDAAHAAAMAEVARYTEAVHTMARQMAEAVQAAVAQAEKAEQDRYDLGKQLEAVCRAIRDNPVLLVPILAAAAIPAAAPVIAPLIGLTTTATAAGLGAAVGAGSAALNRQDLLKGALGGALTGGLGAVAAPLAAVPSVSINMAASAGSAVITGQNPVAAAVGSAVGGALGGSAPLQAASTTAVGRFASNVATATVANAASAAVVDPRQVVAAVASGIVGGAASAASSAASAAAADRIRPQSPVQSPVQGPAQSPAQSPATVGSVPRAVPTPNTPGPDADDGPSRSAAHPRAAEPPGSATGQPSAPSPNNTHSPSSPANSSVAGVGSSVVASSGGSQVSVTVDGNYVSTNGTIGFSRTASDGTVTRYAAGASSIYPGGAVYEQAVSRPAGSIGAPPQQHLDHNSSSAAVRPNLPEAARVLHENIGVCCASRVVQHVTVSGSGQTTHTVVHEHHLNSEGCIGNPGRALVIGGGAVMLAPVLALPAAALLPAAIPIHAQ